MSFFRRRYLSAPKLPQASCFRCYVYVRNKATLDLSSHIFALLCMPLVKMMGCIYTWYFQSDFIWALLRCKQKHKSSCQVTLFSYWLTFCSYSWCCACSFCCCSQRACIFGINCLSRMLLAKQILVSVHKCLHAFSWPTHKRTNFWRHVYLRFAGQMLAPYVL